MDTPPSPPGNSNTTNDSYTDNRARGDWKSLYPADARDRIWWEAVVLIGSFFVLSVATAFFLGLSSQTANIPLWTTASTANETPPPWQHSDNY
jgi:hypothetical protein